MICVNPNVKPNFDIAATIPTSSNVPGCTPLMAAAAAKDAACCLSLLKMFVAVDSTDNNGWTAAHYAGRKGSLEALKGLSVSGANMCVQSSRPTEVTKGGKKHIETVKGFTPLHLLVKFCAYPRNRFLDVSQPPAPSTP